MIRYVLANLAWVILVVALFFVALIYAVPSRAAPMQCGVASFYSYEAGPITASGEPFDPNLLTAAMPSRKHLGERYRVHFGHRSVVVRINDVGPRGDLHRIIDLSRAAAVEIGLIGRGVGTVCLERLH